MTDMNASNSVARLTLPTQLTSASIQRPREDLLVISKRLFLLSMLIMNLGLCAYAQQSATATLSGAVRDPNGALVSGAQVIVTQNTTGVRRETTSNDDGLFVITNL